MIDKIKAGLTKLVAVIMKEFFLLFIYAVISILLGAVLWGLLRIIPNQQLYAQLQNEFEGSLVWIGVFFFVISFGSIYLFRFLSFTVKSTLVK